MVLEVLIAVCGALIAVQMILHAKYFPPSRSGQLATILEELHSSSEHQKRAIKWLAVQSHFQGFAVEVEFEPLTGGRL